MGDQYNIGQAGAVGPGSHADHSVFQQGERGPLADMDLSALAEELALLLGPLKTEAQTPEQDISVGAVAGAEAAARAGNREDTLKHLEAAGNWALDVATKLGTAIGTGLAVAALKGAKGL